MKAGKRMNKATDGDETSDTDVDEASGALNFYFSCADFFIICKKM